MISRPKRILVLSVSAGSGHIRAAEAIRTTALLTHPDTEVIHLDLLELAPAAFRKFYGQGYLHIIEKAPLVWAYLYQQTDRPGGRSWLDRFRQHVEQFNTRHLDAEIERLQPEAIICTHFLPADILSRKIQAGRPLPPIWVHVTDFDIHGLWLQPHMQGYCVASPEVAARLAGRGIPTEQIHVTGIAIMPQFSQPPSRREAAQMLGLSPDDMTLTLMSGGAGVGLLPELVGPIAALPYRLQIIALTGHNDAMLATLQKQAKNYPAGRVIPMGFTRTIEQVMAISDLAITKPGGLTTSECLAMQLPMIIISPIPGQEERNADTLLESGCALKAVDSSALLYKIRLLLEAPERLHEISKNQQILARPEAARTILDIVHEYLLWPPQATLIR